jgi:hypothetical protein
MRGIARDRLRPAVAFCVAAFTAASASAANVLGPFSPAEVGDLYDALADPANDGATILLGPGTFTLFEGHMSAPDGRIVLREGMEIQGQNAYIFDANGVPVARDASGEVFADPASETIIDGSALTSGTIGIGGTPYIVRAGRYNRIANLSVVVNNTIVGGCIAFDQPSSAGGLHGEVTGCVLGPARGGLGCVMVGAPFDGVESSVSVEQCVVREIFGFGGIAIGSFLTNGSSWEAHLRSNRFYDNRVGLILANFGADDATIDALSQGNVYEQNRRGVQIIGETEFRTVRGSTGDLVRLDSQGDVFSADYDAGFHVIGAELQTLPFAGMVSNSNVRVSLLGDLFGGNGRSRGSHRDIVFWGVVCDPTDPVTGLGPLPGIDNTIEALIRQCNTFGVDAASSINLHLGGTDGSCVDPSGTDTVTIIGSDQSLESANGDGAFPEGP